jgi:hypothetical protein
MDEFNTHPSPNNPHTQHTSAAPFDTCGSLVDALVPMCALPGDHLHGLYVPYHVRAQGACDLFLLLTLLEIVPFVVHACPCLYA